MKIGFIDYYLDEWHANNYPEWIKQASDGEIQVCFAYGMTASPSSGMTTDEWCKKFGVQKCESIAEVVEKSDAMIVLSPDNCELHEQLCELPLKSGKPVYVDKTFAPDLATGKRIFAVAEQNGTPCYSTSALRYAAEYADVDIKAVKCANLFGAGDFETYSIHQLEPLVMLMNEKAKRVMMLGGNECHTLCVEFESGRFGTITQYLKGIPFSANICTSEQNHTLKIESDFFMLFIKQLVDFFKNPCDKVPHSQTLTIMALREAGAKAEKCVGEWIDVE